MRYQKLNRFSDSEFKRLVGVPRPVFTEMVEVLEKAESLKKKSGRPHTLDIEDQLLLTLNYIICFIIEISYFKICKTLIYFKQISHIINIGHFPVKLSLKSKHVFFSELV